MAGNWIEKNDKNEIGADISSKLISIIVTIAIAYYFRYLYFLSNDKNILFEYTIDKSLRKSD
ncbi:hypothetical protein GCM10025884_08170 [Leuconostoc gelidum subsp. gelidum]|nr:hypothetical protein GCM10025884_08170 [Leuconostoc gelidum subsp. gelidum]